MRSGAWTRHNRYASSTCYARISGRLTRISSTSDTLQPGQASRLLRDHELTTVGMVALDGLRQETQVFLAELIDVRRPPQYVHQWDGTPLHISSLFRRAGLRPAAPDCSVDPQGYIQTGLTDLRTYMLQRPYATTLARQRAAACMTRSCPPRRTRSSTTRGQTAGRETTSQTHNPLEERHWVDFERCWTLHVANGRTSRRTPGG